MPFTGVVGGKVEGGRGGDGDAGLLDGGDWVVVVVVVAVVVGGSCGGSCGSCGGDA